MKVSTIKKVTEFSKVHNIPLDYEELLRFGESGEENYLLKLIDDRNRNINAFISYVNYDLRNPKWDVNFANLKSMNNFDVKEYIRNKIISAPSNSVALAILRYFDLGCRPYLLSLFESIEEYDTYINNLDKVVDDTNFNDIFLPNLDLTLRSENFNRCHLIEQVMICSQKSINLDKYLFNERLKPMLNIVATLVAKGSHIDQVLTFGDNYEKKVAKRSQKYAFYNKTYDDVFRYLEDSDFVADLEVQDIVISIFNSLEYNSIEKITSMFQEIEQENKKELFKICVAHADILKAPNREDFCYYIEEILYANTSSYRDSLLKLLDESIIVSNDKCQPRTDLETLCHQLDKAEQIDGSCREFADFIAKVGDICIADGLCIFEENKNTRSVIYEKFPQFVDKENLTRNKVENYIVWLINLSYFAPIDCSKILDIISLPVIKSMDDKNQQQVRELLLNSENLRSLDYIYEEYRAKNNEFNEYCNIHPTIHPNDDDSARGQYNPQVSLLTVSAALSNNYDINEVLAGFNEDDDITPKTLIRSFRYKK